MLWVDKHRPRGLEKLTFHPELTSKLSAIAEKGDLPHLLLYGPSGAGKRTRVLSLLRALYGPGAEKIRLEQRSFKTPSKRVVEISTLGSNYHIEMNPSDAGIYDRYVVQEVIKEIAQYSPLNTTSQRSFKVVFLSEADQLTKDAQHALRRTMEKYVGTCRLILCCEGLGRIIEPLRSRCLCIRVPAPSHADICDLITTTCTKEGLDIPGEFASRLATHSGRNARKALLTLEACRVQSYPFNATQMVQLPDWEVYIAETAALIARQQSAASLLEVRGRLYELLGNCIPPDLILKQLTRALWGKADDGMKPKLASLSAEYDVRLKQGQKAIYHLEAFVANYMAALKRYMVEMFG